MGEIEDRRLIYSGFSYIIKRKQEGECNMKRILAALALALVMVLCMVPSEVQAAQSETGIPRISWEKVEGAEKYQVYRATSKDGTYKRIATTKNLYLVNKNAVAGKTYYYKVRAVHPITDANSAFSTIQYIKAK